MDETHEIDRFIHDVGVVLDAFQRELLDLLPRLRRFARSLTRDPTDADDLLQAAVERGLKQRSHWQPGSRLDNWMFKLMKNAWIDETRSRKRRGRVITPDETAERVADSQAPGLDARRTADAVTRAMRNLPDDQRVAVSLVLIEGLSYREAADVLEAPIGTLTSRLARGRASLMAELDGLGA